MDPEFCPAHESANTQKPNNVFTELCCVIFQLIIDHGKVN